MREGCSTIAWQCYGPLYLGKEQACGNPSLVPEWLIQEVDSFNSPQLSSQSIPISALLISVKEKDLVLLFQVNSVRPKLWNWSTGAKILSRHQVNKWYWQGVAYCQQHLRLMLSKVNRVMFPRCLYNWRCSIKNYSYRQSSCKLTPRSIARQSQKCWQATLMKLNG